MQNTLRMFSHYVQKEKLFEPLESLAIEYQATHSQAIVATAFYKVHQFVTLISHQFIFIPEQDIVGWAVEKLEYCLQHFKVSVKVKFITFFGSLLNMRITEEVKALNMQKRKLNAEAISYDALIEQGFDIPGNNKDNMLFELEMNKALTSKEKLFCVLVLMKWSSIEIAQALGVNQMGLTTIRKSLRCKVAQGKFQLLCS